MPKFAENANKAIDRSLIIKKQKSIKNVAKYGQFMGGYGTRHSSARGLRYFPPPSRHVALHKCQQRVAVRSRAVALDVLLQRVAIQFGVLCLKWLLIKLSISKSTSPDRPRQSDQKAYGNPVFDFSKRMQKKLGLQNFFVLNSKFLFYIDNSSWPFFLGPIFGP